MATMLLYNCGGVLVSGRRLHWLLRARGKHFVSLGNVKQSKRGLDIRLGASPDGPRDAEELEVSCK